MKSMRQWLISAVAVLMASTIGCHAQDAPKNDVNTAQYGNRARIGINIAGIADYSSELPFNDIFKTSRAWISQREGAGWGQGPKLTLDKNGYVTQLQTDARAETPMLTDIGGHFPQGEYLLTYQGKGDIDFNNVAGIVSRDAGRIVFKPKAESGFFLRLNKIDAQNPIREIRILLPGQHEGRAVFNPTFLQRIQPFGAIRFMDWGATNGSPLEKWADRPQLSDASWSVGKGVPIEKMVELANAQKSGAWFTIPHRADEDFVRRMAQMVKDTLDPTLKIYIEYSNEVWNGQFEQARYASEQGKKLGLSDNDFQSQLRFYSQRSVEIYRIWKEVFGQQKNRLVCVMGSQSVNPWVSEQVLGWKDAFKEVDALAIAPYFGGQFGDPKRQTEVASWSVDQLMNKLDDEVNGQNRQNIADIAAVAKKFRVKMFAYEGGQHLVGHGGAENNQKLQDLFVAANRDARMETLYRQHLTNWFDQGGDLYMVFSSVGGPSKWGSWGVLEYQDQPIEDAPKYRALVDFVKNAKLPAS